MTIDLAKIEARKYEVVVAANLNDVIGRGSKIPWKSKEDFTHFKKLTAHHTIVMGRKTFESLGRKLLDRYHVVISRNVAYRHKPYQPDLVVTDLREVFYLRKDEPLLLIGGSEIIQQAFDLDLVKKIHLTRVLDVADGDIKLPKIPDTFKLSNETFRSDCKPELRFQTYIRQ